MPLTMNWKTTLFGILFCVAFLFVLRACDDDGGYGRRVYAQTPAPGCGEARAMRASLQTEIDSTMDADTVRKLNAAIAPLDVSLTACDQARLNEDTAALLRGLPAFLRTAGKRSDADKPAAEYRTEDGMALPDAAMTPGAVNGAVVADTSGRPHNAGGVELNICAKDFRARALRKKIRNFAGLKRRACEEYGVAKCDGRVEGDHLISLELGGCADCLANIWPEPMDEARVKDHQVEDKLPGLVCSGKISLADAQRCIAADWVKCARRLAKLDAEK